MKKTSLSFCTWSQPLSTAVVLILKIALINVSQCVLKCGVMEINRCTYLKIIEWESLSELQGFSQKPLRYIGPLAEAKEDISDNTSVAKWYEILAFSLRFRTTENHKKQCKKRYFTYAFSFSWKDKRNILILEVVTEYEKQIRGIWK